VAAFNAECRRIGTSEEALEKAEKRGLDTGIRVRHPFDNAWELPVYIANFILMDYGTGAIFGCPRMTSATSTSPRSTACRPDLLRVRGPPTRR
jgi:leucyl-tRNA synthetase